MSKTPYMHMYWGDFIADTLHLSGCEVGAYTLLLGSMWRAGGSLPRDDKKLAQIARQTPEGWAEMRDTIMAFFDVRGGQIVQKRLTSELERAKVRSEAGKQAGKASAFQRSKKNNDMASTDVANPLQRKSNLSESDRYTPPTPPPGGDDLFGLIEEATPPPKVDCEALSEAIWSGAPRMARQRSSQKLTLRAVRSALKAGTTPEDLRAGVEGFYRQHPDVIRDDGAYAPGLHVVIGQERWREFVGSAAVKVTSVADVWATRDPRKAANDVIEYRFGQMRGERHWIDALGPPPGEPGCLVPAEVIAVADRRLAATKANGYRRARFEDGEPWPGA